MTSLSDLPRTITVSVQRAEDGFIGRQCPVEECGGYFKIEPGTGLKGKELPCRCPYCNHTDEQAAFTTKEQIKYAKSVALSRVTSALLEDLKTMERHIPVRGPLGIGLSIDVRGQPHPIHHYREKELETEVVCNDCTLHYAIYGAFGFCPDCGSHNSLRILEKNLELARKKVLLAATLEADMQADLVRDALVNIVSAFDGFGREACRVHAARSADPAKAAGIHFQNLNGARNRVQELFGFDLSSAVTASDWHFAHVCFQKRHLIQHRAGVVDQQYLNETGDPNAVLGRKIQVAADEVVAASQIIGTLGAYLVAQLGPAQGVPVATSPPDTIAPIPAPSEPLPGFGLSLDAQRIAVFLNEKSERGNEGDDFFQVPDLLHELRLTEDDLDLALDELKDRDWVTLHEGTRGDSQLWYFMVSPKAQLFFETDNILRHSNPAEDAKTVAKIIVDRGTDGAALQELDEVLAWGPRRINPAAEWLVSRGLVQPLRSNSEPYAYAFLRVTAKTKRLVRENR